MIKLQEGQKILDEDGNEYLIEENDVLVEKNNDLYAVYDEKERRLYKYDTWFEKPVEYIEVKSEDEAILIATKKWRIPLNKVKVQETIQESLNDRDVLKILKKEGLQASTIDSILGILATTLDIDDVEETLHKYMKSKIIESLTDEQIDLILDIAKNFG